MSKEPSKRCGCFLLCPLGHGDSSNKVSGCKVFDDRNDCTISRKQRKKAASHARTRAERDNWWL